MLKKHNKADSPSLLYGFHPVVEAIRAGRRKIHKVYVVRQKSSERYGILMALAQDAGIQVEHLPQQTLSALLKHRRHQGVAAEVSAYPLVSMEMLLRGGDERPVLLVLDQIVDPQNFGAMARTAQCAGARGMIIPKDRSAPPSPAVSKASAGALEHMRVASVTNLPETLKSLKKAGYWIAGADRHGEVNLFNADFRQALAIVIGGEEKGLRPLVRKQCDYTVTIPQIGPMGSLNASVAAGVLLYEVFRQRQFKAVQ
jgi:23S rRNA (guanosine2251-2'-O)-methyltransferase